MSIGDLASRLDEAFGPVLLGRARIGRMDIAGKVVVVTGGGSGIGEACCHRFGAAGAAGVLVVDQHADRAARVADAITAAGGTASPYAADISYEEGTVGAIRTARERYGPVDLFHANAGVGLDGGEEVPDDGWDWIWKINVMPHIHAARTLIPEWLERGSGYLVTTSSAAGLLTTLGSAPYAATKHAALAFAEWMSIKYHSKGIRFSCVCPQGVITRMTMGDDLSGAREGQGTIEQLKASGDMLEPAQVADALMNAIAEERFLVLPHPEVADYARMKADNEERWLAGMRKLRARTFV